MTSNRLPGEDDEGDDRHVAERTMNPASEHRREVDARGVDDRETEHEIANARAPLFIERAPMFDRILDEIRSEHAEEEDEIERHEAAGDRIEAPRKSRDAGDDRC